MILLRCQTCAWQARARRLWQDHRFRSAQAAMIASTPKSVPNASKATLQAIIRGKAGINSVIHTDGWHGYDGLVDIGFDGHFRVNHGNNAFVKGRYHINGIESFWSFAKRRLAQSSDMPGWKQHEPENV